MRIKFITLLCAMLALGVFIGYSDAQIDPEKIVGIWLLDEDKGDKVEDVSGNGYDGTITQSDWVNGKVDGALDIIVKIKNIFTFFQFL